jgi:hypothetical protein
LKVKLVREPFWDGGELALVAEGVGDFLGGGDGLPAGDILGLRGFGAGVGFGCGGVPKGFEDRFVAVSDSEERGDFVTLL